MRKRVVIILPVVFLLFVVSIFVTCSDDPSSPLETISPPDAPAGDDVAAPDESKTYTTGGAVSNLGHAVAYRFDIDAAGAHSYTAWSAVDTVAVAWPDSGLYSVKAQARCAEHTTKVSEWSPAKQVAVASEVISTPAAPSGPAGAWPDSLVTYCTGVALSNKGHDVEYQFDWDAAGARDTTAWDATTCLENSWPTTGSYEVKTRGRCAADTLVVSGWSPAKTVMIAGEIITAPTAPTGVVQLWLNVPFEFCTGGATSELGHALEYQFDWDAAGAGDRTGWDFATCLEHSWPTAGSYVVKTRARCATHHQWVSPWSDGATAVVHEVTELPTMRFATHINGVHKPYNPAAVLDTVGMFRPFAMSYHGLTTNGMIRAYQFFSLTPGVVLPGENEWMTDLQDTLRIFSNAGADALPSGTFRLAAQCRDDALAESFVDAAAFTEGVCRVVVNFDPDTKIFSVQNSYSVGGVNRVKAINFADGVPDTVSFRSWLRLIYTAWDDPRDSTKCSPINADRCIDYQVRCYTERHTDDLDTSFDTGWQPWDGVHDSDSLAVTDSTTFSVGSAEETFFVRSIDERARPDGTPPSVPIVGNFVPTLDSVAVEDHFGRRLNLAVVDTIQWNFWKGEGWPYDSIVDTLDVYEMKYYKTFSFKIKSWGHDHPWDPPGSGVKAWRYNVTNSSGQNVPLGNGGAGFVDGPAVDVLDDEIRIRFLYPMDDPTGDSIFDNLPSWFDDDLTVTLIGRDTGVREPDYRKYIFLNGVKTLLGAYDCSRMGRRTEEKEFTFRVRLTR